MCVRLCVERESVLLLLCCVQGPFTMHFEDRLAIMLLSYLDVCVFSCCMWFLLCSVVVDEKGGDDNDVCR